MQQAGTCRDGSRGEDGAAARCGRAETQRRALWSHGHAPYLRSHAPYLNLNVGSSAGISELESRNEDVAAREHPELGWRELDESFRLQCEGSHNSTGLASYDSFKTVVLKAQEWVMWVPQLVALLALHVALLARS